LTETLPVAKSRVRPDLRPMNNEIERSCTPPDTVKFAGLVAVPPGVVSVTRPVVAPLGTVALTRLAETNEKVADVPLNLTDVTPPKLVPMIATDVPTAPLVGDRLVIRGPTVKVPLLVAVPAEVVTVILPVLAPLGTVVLILLTLTTLNAADVPWNRTALTLVNPVPLIATAVPTPPLVGEKLVMVSPPEVTTKLALLVPVPAGVVTEIFPVVAPFGTVVWILPGPTIVNGVAGVPLNRTKVAPVK